jgi:hypothetical protein
MVFPLSISISKQEELLHRQIEKVHNYLKEGKERRKEGREGKEAHHKSKCGQYNNMAEMLLKCPLIMMYTCQTLIAIKPLPKGLNQSYFSVVKL